MNGTIVRAGIESDIFNNAACGLPVTSDQASIPGAHIPIVCDPPVIARYVSVEDDIPTADSNALTLCEVMVEEYPMEDCHQTRSKEIIDCICVPFFSQSCVLNVTYPPFSVVLNDCVIVSYATPMTTRPI